MSEYYNGNTLKTATCYKVGEHIIGTDEDTNEEHVLEVTYRSVRINNTYTYVVKVIDDQYATNNLGIE